MYVTWVSTVGENVGEKVSVWVDLLTQSRINVIREKTGWVV